MKVFTIASLIGAALALVDTTVEESTLATITDKTFFDIEIDGEAAGRIVAGLYGEVVPRTVENFAVLCEGSAGVDAEGIPMWYQGSKLHRIIPDFMA